MAPPSSRGAARRRTALRASTVALTGSAIALGGSVAMLAPGVGNASSHREAPLIANDAQVDHTDLYGFVSPDKSKTVTLIANVSPFQNPPGGPNFYPFADNARYNINIDNNGDAKPDVIYRWTFKTNDLRGTDTFLYNNGPVTSLTDKNLLFRQTYKLERIKDGKATTLASDVPVAPSDVGKASMPDYSSLRKDAIKSLKGGGKSFAGQADDPFFIDLRVFDLLYGGDLSETGANSTNGFNVNTLAVQVPAEDVTAGKDPVIGIWATNERPGMRVQKADGTQKYSGDYVQVSRLGMPLVNEVVIPTGLKDAFNALPPVKDHTIQPVVDRVTDPEVPKLIEAIYGIQAPKTPRNDLVAIYLTGLKGLNMPADLKTPAEMLRLNTSIKPTANPNRLGVLAGDNAGFPNGRRLSDDVIDISLQAIEGAVDVNKKGAPTGVNIVKPLAEGDRVNSNDKSFNSSFPYVALPTPGSEPRPGSLTNGSGTPSGAMNTGAQIQTGGFPAMPVAAGGLGAVLAGLGLVLLRRDRRRAVPTS